MKMNKVALSPVILCKMDLAIGIYALIVGFFYQMPDSH